MYTGVAVEVGATEIKLVKPGVAQVAFPVKLAHLTALKAGQLGTLAKQSMSLQLRSLVIEDAGGAAEPRRRDDRGDGAVRRHVGAEGADARGRA